MQPVPPVATAPHILQTREVMAVHVINGVAELNGYPFRHLGVTASGTWRIPARTELLVAVEILSQWGWHLVSVIRPHDSSALAAFLRRD